MASKLSRMMICVGWVHLAIGCGASDDSDLSRIIGDNDLVKIDTKNGDRDLVRAIGRMELGCTATHIGNGLAVTAGHCFASRPFEGRRQNLKCGSNEFNVTWGLLYNSKGYMTSSCQSVVSTEYNGARDYAIFRVSPVPSASVRVSSRAPHIGDKISILSHPRKRPLEWSGYCKIDGYYPHSNRQQFSYECDTEGGSSGAAVLNEKLEVVGIHNYYNEEYNRNGATLAFSTPLRSLPR